MSAAAERARAEDPLTGEVSRFEVAFVCTGNRFRSPLAAALAARGAPEWVRTRSAGVLELGPVPALPEAIELAAGLEVDLAEHRAADLSHVDLTAVDLVLGFEQAHVRTVAVDASAAIERTFTLPELVDLLEALPERATRRDPVEQARARIAQAHEARPANFRRTQVDEVRDPLGRPPDEQRAVASEVDDLVRRLLRLLFH